MQRVIFCLQGIMEPSVVTNISTVLRFLKEVCPPLILNLSQLSVKGSTYLVEDFFLVWTGQLSKIHLVGTSLLCQ